MSKSRDLVRKGSFLVMISVFIKFIGLIYRIPLTNMLGDTGNGYYGVAFQIYSFFIILSTIGVSEAISRMISERVARRGYANARQVFWVGLIYAGSTGLLYCLILVCGADFIAGTIFNRPPAAAAVRSLCAGNADGFSLQCISRNVSGIGRCQTYGLCRPFGSGVSRAIQCSLGLDYDRDSIGCQRGDRRSVSGSGGRGVSGGSGQYVRRSGRTAVFDVYLFGIQGQILNL